MNLLQVYKYCRWLSLDVTVGAIVFLAYWGKYYGVFIPLPVYAALGSAVWLVYTADHLMDARRTDVATPRHLFHQRNRKGLNIGVGLVLAGAAFNLFWLPAEILLTGSVLAGLCVAYLLAVYLFPRMWCKEPVVAVVYACGIFLPPCVLAGRSVLTDALLLMDMMLLALANLVLFSIFDRKEDALAGFGSLALRLGNRASSVLLWVVLAVLVTGNLMAALFVNGAPYWLFVVMATLLSLPLFFPHFFGKNERYRTLGDGVFLVPLFFML